MLTGRIELPALSYQLNILPLYYASKMESATGIEPVSFVLQTKAHPLYHTDMEPFEGFEPPPSGLQDQCFSNQALTASAHDKIRTCMPRRELVFKTR